MTRETDVDRRLDGERRSRELGAALAALAARQHGVVERSQLRRIGFTDDEIDGAIAAGRLHPIHRGVYAVGHRRLSREGRYLAAVLAAGEGAVLSHAAAADLWELRATKERRIDVIAPADRRGDRTLRVRRNGIGREDVSARYGIPVTTPLRTLLDIASCVTQSELERAIRQAVYLRLTTTAALADAVEGHAGRRGMRSLRRALVSLGEAPGLTRSELEQRFLRFVRKHDLPMPRLNAQMRLADKWIEADCLWGQQRLIVELDGRDAHHSLPAFESDRARDSALVAEGWRIVRVTSRRIRMDGDTLARELRALLL